MTTETEMNEEMIAEVWKELDVFDVGSGFTIISDLPEDGDKFEELIKRKLNKARQQGAKAERERLINELIYTADICFTAGYERDKLKIWLREQLRKGK